MRDLVILFFIILFWFALGFTSYYLHQDAFIAGGYTSTNANYMQPEGYEGSTGDEIALFTPSVNDTSKSVLTTIGSITSFDIGGMENVPTAIGLFIGFINFLLAFYCWLIIYRLIRHGGS